jgi:hypothetical protein
MRREAVSARHRLHETHAKKNLGTHAAKCALCALERKNARKTMKRRYTALSAAVVLLAGAIALGCKKEEQETPVNLPETPPGCSFCPGEALDLDSNGIISAAYAEQVVFYNASEEGFGPEPLEGKTALGFFGVNNGTAIAFDFSDLLVCAPKRITFVHARNAVNTNPDPALINVQFPGTPLLVANPDSLDILLSPYGYSVQHFFEEGTVFMNGPGGPGSFPGVVDSIIITGPEFETVTIGANLFESELRSICVSNE